MSQNNKDNIKECKVVLLGEAFVGKTCIAERLINDKFVENILATTSASYLTKIMELDKLEEKYIKFEIWDTAGQEKYRALSKIFYKDSEIAILVYDITNKKSFEEIKNYWYKQLKENGPKNMNK